MSIVVLVSPENQDAERIQAILEQVAPDNGVETHSTVEGLIRRLWEPLGTQCITILVPATRADLAELVACEETLNRTRIVLVVPDEEEATISLGHRLRPRVLLHGPDFLEYLMPIIAKMSTNPASHS